MLPLLILGVSAFLFTLAITPACRSLCTRVGWVDKPDIRKVHRGAIPRAGGIVIFLGYAAALALVRFSPLWDSYSSAWAPLSVRALLPAVLVCFATGLLDDIFGLKPWMKLLGQLLAAALACNAGVQIHNVAGYSVANTWWHVPLTALWLVGCANAFNLIDGLDGLAVGVGLFATATSFLSALLSGNIALALMTAPLLGMTAPLIALAVPLLDTALAISRRFLRRQPIFGADRSHIHHRLLARGFTPRRVAYVIYAGAGVVAGLSLLFGSASNHVG